jgi:predicted DCC family thiol-disulfide oxidoreductase YuxK
MPLTRLFVIYDAGCGLCTRVKDWMGRQASLLDLEFVASASADARARFPQLPAGELAAVGNNGDVWLGNRAWIVCLWALRDYREWAFRLSSPLLTLLAREAFTVISGNRAALSRMLQLRSQRELEVHLRAIMVPRCQNEPK